MAENTPHKPQFFSLPAPPADPERIEAFMRHSRRRRRFLDTRRRLEIAQQRGFKAVKIDLDDLQALLDRWEDDLAGERETWAPK